MFFRALFVSALALSAAALCPSCQPIDLVGNLLSAQSGGTGGTPLFCGYTPTASVVCSYDTATGKLRQLPSADTRCPPIASFEDC